MFIRIMSKACKLNIQASKFPLKCVAEKPNYFCLRKKMRIPF